MAVKLETTDPHAAFRRRFTLLDAMIAVAALAVGFGVIRYLGLGFEWEFYGNICSHSDSTTSSIACAGRKFAHAE